MNGNLGLNGNIVLILNSWFGGLYDCYSRKYACLGNRNIVLFGVRGHYVHILLLKLQKKIKDNGYIFIYRDRLGDRTNVAKFNNWRSGRYIPILKCTWLLEKWNYFHLNLRWVFISFISPTNTRILHCLSHYFGCKIYRENKKNNLDSSRIHITMEVCDSFSEVINSLQHYFHLCYF